MQELARTGVPQKLIDRVEQDVDQSTITIWFTDGTYYGPYPLPEKPINPRGPWAAGVDYVASDLYVDAGSSYLVLTNHTSTTVAEDEAAGRTLCIARAGTDGKDGSDSEAFKGAYDATVAYAKGDIVTVGTGAAMVTWKAPRGWHPGLDDAGDGPALA